MFPFTQKDPCISVRKTEEKNAKKRAAKGRQWKLGGTLKQLLFRAEVRISELSICMCQKVNAGRELGVKCREIMFKVCGVYHFARLLSRDVRACQPVASYRSCLHVRLGCSEFIPAYSEVCWDRIGFRESCACSFMGRHIWMCVFHLSTKAQGRFSSVVLSR